MIFRRRARYENRFLFSLKKKLKETYRNKLNEKNYYKFKVQYYEEIRLSCYGYLLLLPPLVAGIPPVPVVNDPGGPVVPTFPRLSIFEPLTLTTAFPCMLLLSDVTLLLEFPIIGEFA